MRISKNSIIKKLFVHGDLSYQCPNNVLFVFDVLPANSLVCPIVLFFSYLTRKGKEKEKKKVHDAIASKGKAKGIGQTGQQDKLFFPNVETDAIRHRNSRHQIFLDAIFSATLIDRVSSQIKSSRSMKTLVWRLSVIGDHATNLFRSEPAKILVCPSRGLSNRWFSTSNRNFCLSTREMVVYLPTVKKTCLRKNFLRESIRKFFIRRIFCSVGLIGLSSRRVGHPWLFP